MKAFDNDGINDRQSEYKLQLNLLIKGKRFSRKN